MEALEDVLIPVLALLGFFASVFAAIWLYFSTRHRERMALIEKGLPLASDAVGGLRAALLLISLGLGVGFGHLTHGRGVPAWVAYTVWLALLAGAALLGSRWLAGRAAAGTRDLGERRGGNP